MKTLRALFAVICLVFFAGLAIAQSGGPDYDAWTSTATRAESAIEANRASVDAMEELRKEVVAFRKQFLDAQSVNQTRISTINAQLESLGPVPEAGDSEPVAERRENLRAQLAQAREPVIQAEEAHSLAEALVAEIDKLIRERLREDFLERSPSPLKLSEWPVAIEHVVRSLRAIGSEAKAARAAPTRTITTHDNLLMIIVLIAVGLVLIARGGRWSRRLGARLALFGGGGARVWRFVVSLGRIILPLVGLMAIAQAIVLTGHLGLRGTALIVAIPAWGAIILLFRWLCEQVFGKDDDDALLNLPPQNRSEARFYGTFLAILIVLRSFFEMLSNFERFSPQIEAILFFPQVLLAGLVFSRLGQILRNIPKPDDAVEGSQKSNAEWLARNLGTAMMAIGIATPILAAFGFTAASKGVIFPMIATTWALAFVLVLNRLATDIYVWVSGKGEAGRDALIPVLFGFTLTLASLPFLALFWGARGVDLYEWWLKFLKGFSVGGVQISPSAFLTFAIVFAIGYSITRVIQGTMRNTVLPKTQIDTGGQTAIVAGLGYVGIFIAAVVAITTAGINLSSLAIVAGALSVGIGFGLQTIVQNFVSGIILLIERPIAEGDWIEVNGQMGYVRDISVRATRIETFDRTDVIIPNADFVSGTVTNYTRGNTVGRVIVKVGVGYGTDTKRVEGILREIANAHPMVLANPAPNIVFHNFGADSLEFEIRAILRDVNWVLSVKSDMNHEIAKRFGEEGIEIPFAQRDIWLRNPEVLTRSES
jgi:potassium-dependent mechanosensitive channel